MLVLCLSAQIILSHVFKMSAFVTYSCFEWCAPLISRLCVVHCCGKCLSAPCGLRGCKNGPAAFPGRMSYKATKPGLVSVLYLSMFFIMLVFIRAPFYVLLVFIVCVLSCVLVKLSLLAKLLARKTPLSSELSPLQFLALA